MCTMMIVAASMNFELPVASKSKCLSFLRESQKESSSNSMQLP